MSNIREAPAQSLEIRPTETGIDATQRAARTIGSLYHQASQDLNAAGELTAATGRSYASGIKTAGDMAVQYEEHREKNAGSANFAQMQLDLTQKWNDTVNAPGVDPNDPTIAAKFREKILEPALEKFGEKGFITSGGQQWAEGHVNALRQHMFEKTASDMSTLAGEAAKVNAAKTVNRAATAVRLDPSSLDFTLGTLDSSLGGVVDSSPTLSPADAGRVKTEVLLKAKEGIVRAAALGMIEKNPNIDLDAFAKKYGQYMPPGEMQQLERAAKSQAKQDLYYQKGIETYQHQQDVRNADANLSKSWTNNVTFDDSGRPTINPQIYKDVMAIEKRYPGAATERAKAIINWSQSQQKEKREAVITDKATQASLLDGLFRTDKPTTDTDIWKASAENKLDAHATQTLLGLYKSLEERPLKGPLYQTALDGAKERLGLSVLADGHERFANAMQAFIPQYLRAMNSPAGVPPNALDLTDETSLLRQTIKRFEPSAREKMEGHILKSMGVSNLGGLNLTGQGEKVISTTVENAKPPEVGTVKDGFRFKGGNPALSVNWEKVK